MSVYLRWRRLRYRLHVLADRIYEATHAPLVDADGLTKKDLDDIAFFHSAVLAKRADEARGIRYVDGAIRDDSGRYARLSEATA